MTSESFLVVIGLSFVAIIFIVQSAPIEPLKELTSKVDHELHKSDDQEKPLGTTSSSQVAVSSLSKDTSIIKQETTDIKRRRDTDSYDQLDDLIKDKSYGNEEDDDDDDDDDDHNNDNYHDDGKVENKLLANIKKLSNRLHDNTDSLNTKNSKIFTDIRMDPNELTRVARKRRYVNIDSKSNQRHKRGLTSYEFYDEDPLYNPLIQRRELFRPNLVLPPDYWYPSVYQRSIRTSRVPSLYQSPEWTKFYPNTIETDDDDEDLTPLSTNFDDAVADDDNDLGENDYDYMRYPILLDAPNQSYDNIQSQQTYNVNDLPTDNEDQYEQRLIATYGPIAYYLK